MQAVCGQSERERGLRVLGGLGFRVALGLGTVWVWVWVVGASGCESRKSSTKGAVQAY